MVLAPSLNLHEKSPLQYRDLFCTLQWAFCVDFRLSNNCNWLLLFLMVKKGVAFVARQQHINAEKED